MLGATAIALLLLSMGLVLYWQLGRDQAPTALRYGEMVQVLGVARPGGPVSLEKAKVSQADVRGEIVTTDLVSDGQDNRPHTQTVRFRALRTGFERDPSLYPLLH